MASAATGSLKNPILPGFNPDPSIIRVGSSYFMTTSTFEYFPGAPIYHSHDLIQWSLIGHALTRKSQLDIRTPEPGGGVWATTIRHHDGVYYVIAASFDRYRPQVDDRVWPRGFYVSTTDVWDSESWSEPVYFDQPGFDQDLFWDDDGTVYHSSTYRMIDRTPGKQLKDFAIHVCTIDLTTGNSTSQPKMIRSSSSGVAEGSHIFKRGKHYYLFTAEGGTESGHSEWVSRSEVGPFGPWELCPRNPLWRNTTDDEIQNTGHADLVEDAEGNWWAVSLGVRPVRKEGNRWETSVFGRETLLMPVTWEDDWPIFNGGQGIGLKGFGPGMYEYDHPKGWRDDFEKSEMQLGWYRKNTPLKSDSSLTERPGYLRLHGGPYTLSVPAAPTLFLRKQTHRDVTWRTRLSFKPNSERTEAGTVVWWNYFTYSSIGIRNKEGQRIIRLRPAEGKEVEMPLQTPDADVVLVIRCGDRYRFGFQEAVSNGKDAKVEGKEEEEEEEGDIKWMGEVSNEVMTRDPPVGAAFTGMMLGLYAFGELERCLVPADFQYAEFY